MQGAGAPAGGAGAGNTGYHWGAGNWGAGNRGYTHMRQSFQAEPLYNGTQNMYLHSLVSMRCMLDAIGDARGKPTAFYNITLKKWEEGVPDHIKCSGRTSITNIIKKPQNNDLDRVIDWMRYIDDYDTCTDKLVMLDDLDPEYKMPLRDATDKYEDYRYKRSVMYGYNTQVKFIALVSAQDVKKFGHVRTDYDIPKEFVDKFQSLFSYFSKSWSIERINYVVDNFYNYQRMEAVLDLYMAIAHKHWYFETHDNVVEPSKMPSFKYTMLIKHCKRMCYDIDDIVKSFTPDLRKYYGVFLELTARQYCKKMNIKGPNGSTLSETLKKRKEMRKKGLICDYFSDEEISSSSEDDPDDGSEDSEKDSVSEDVDAKPETIPSASASASTSAEASASVGASATDEIVDEVGEIDEIEATASVGSKDPFETITVDSHTSSADIGDDSDAGVSMAIVPFSGGNGDADHKSVGSNSSFEWRFWDSNNSDDGAQKTPPAYNYYA